MNSSNGDRAIEIREGVVMGDGSSPLAPTRPEAGTAIARRTKPSLVGRIGIAGAIIGLVLLAMGVAQVGFGSIHVAILYLRGERLILSPADVRVEGLTRSKPVRVTARIWNYTGNPVRLLGSSVKCSCVTVKEMPEMIPAGVRSELVFEVHALAGSPEVDQEVAFFTDHATRPVLGAHVTARVLD